MMDRLKPEQVNQLVQEVEEVMSERDAQMSSTQRWYIRLGTKIRFGYPLWYRLLGKLLNRLSAFR
jgi:hypothetical protein